MVGIRDIRPLDVTLPIIITSMAWPFVVIFTAKPIVPFTPRVLFHFTMGLIRIPESSLSCTGIQAGRERVDSERCRSEKAETPARKCLDCGRLIDGAFETPTSWDPTSWDGVLLSSFYAGIAKPLIGPLARRSASGPTDGFVAQARRPHALTVFANAFTPFAQCGIPGEIQGHASALDTTDRALRPTPKT